MDCTLTGYSLTLNINCMGNYSLVILFDFMIHVETSDFWWFETRDFELILNILFLGIAEGADLNTFIMKIRVGKNNYKMSILNNISSHVALCPIRLEPLLYLFWQW